MWKMLVPVARQRSRLSAFLRLNPVNFCLCSLVLIGLVLLAPPSKAAFFCEDKFSPDGEIRQWTLISSQRWPGKGLRLNEEIYHYNGYNFFKIPVGFIQPYMSDEKWEKNEQGGFLPDDFAALTRQVYGLPDDGKRIWTWSSFNPLVAPAPQATKGWINRMSFWYPELRYVEKSWGLESGWGRPCERGRPHYPLDDPNFVVNIEVYWVAPDVKPDEKARSSFNMMNRIMQKQEETLPFEFEEKWTYPETDHVHTIWRHVEDDRLKYTMTCYEPDYKLNTYEHCKVFIWNKEENYVYTAVTPKSGSYRVT